MDVEHDSGANSCSFPDAGLLDAISAGDQDALAAFHARHSRRIYSVALRVLRDPSAAEDVLQEIMMQIWRSPSSFSAVHGSFEGWLAVVAKNRAIDMLRSRKPSDPLEGLILTAKNNVAAEVEDTLMLAGIWQHVNSLPEEQRRVVELAYVRGLTHAEISRETGDPLGTVKTRLRYAIQSLRKKLNANRVQA